MTPEEARERLAKAQAEAGLSFDGEHWYRRGVPIDEPAPPKPSQAMPTTAELMAVFNTGRNSNGDGTILDPSWEPIDLADVLSGKYDQPSPAVLARDDMQALLYLQTINGIHGDSGVGKGFIACEAIVQQLQRGHAVMLIDLEDVAASIVARLRMLGATDTQIAERFIYLRPMTEFGLMAVDHLIAIINERGVRLVVIDSTGEAFGLDGINEDRDNEVGPWMRRVARRLAEAGPAVLLIDHATKALDNPLHPSGSKRKRAAIGGASYLVTAVKPLTVGSGGRLRLTCAKDRHGTFGRGDHVADFVMAVEADGRVHVTLYAPSDSSATPVDLPAELAARAAVAVVREADRPMTRNEVIGLMKIRAGTDAKRAGVDIAIGRGALLAANGPRGSTLLTFYAELVDPSDG